MLLFLKFKIIKERFINIYNKENKVINEKNLKIWFLFIYIRLDILVFCYMF